MKTIFISNLIFVLFFSLNVFSQHKGHAHKKVHHKHHHPHAVKKTHPNKFYRKNIRIVRARVYSPFKIMPNGHVVYNFRGNKHYCYNGRFYRFYNNMYHLYAPPIGLRINTLPIGYHRILIKNRPIFYFHGVFYTQVNNEYEVVDPEIGAIVPELPEDLTEEVSLNGNTYYEYNNFLYKKTTTNNKDNFEVVGKLED